MFYTRCHTLYNIVIYYTPCYLNWYFFHQNRTWIPRKLEQLLIVADMLVFFIVFIFIFFIISYTVILSFTRSHWSRDILKIQMKKRNNKKNIKTVATFFFFLISGRSILHGPPPYGNPLFLVFVIIIYTMHGPDLLIKLEQAMITDHGDWLVKGKRYLKTFQYWKCIVNIGHSRMIIP